MKHIDVDTWHNIFSSSAFFYEANWSRGSIQKGSVKLLSLSQVWNWSFFFSKIMFVFIQEGRADLSWDWVEIGDERNFLEASDWIENRFQILLCRLRLAGNITFIKYRWFAAITQVASKHHVAWLVCIGILVRLYRYRMNMSEQQQDLLRHRSHMRIYKWQAVSIRQVRHGRLLPLWRESPRNFHRHCRVVGRWLDDGFDSLDCWWCFRIFTW